MDGRFLLDTNILIAMLSGVLGVRASLSQADEAFLPCITVGELYYGALKSSKPEQNVLQIDKLVSNSSILECNLETARQYGEVKHQLQLQGRPIPENDVWIAALALQFNLTLATRDEHFVSIQNLLIIRW